MGPADKKPRHINVTNGLKCIPQELLFELALILLFFWWNRVPCEYKNQNLALRVEESSQKPHYLAVKVLYQGGQTEIVSIDVAQVSQNIHI